jgi:hypothetical protein
VNAKILRAYAQQAHETQRLEHEIRALAAQARALAAAIRRQP